MKNKKTDIDDTRVLPLEEIINMRRRIHDLEDIEEDTVEVEESLSAGKRTFVLDTSGSTKLRREALERKENKKEEASTKEEADVVIPFVKMNKEEIGKEEPVHEYKEEASTEKKVADDAKLSVVVEDAKEPIKETENKDETHVETSSKQDHAEEKQDDHKEVLEEVMDTSSKAVDEVKDGDETSTIEAKEESTDDTSLLSSNTQSSVEEEKDVSKEKEEIEKADDTTGDEVNKDVESNEYASEEKAQTNELPSVLKQEEDTKQEKLTYEEKKKQELAQKPTLEEKRSTDPQKATLEEKRKKELEHALTLEEKRKQQLENKMTLEEKRALRKQGVYPEKQKASFSIKTYLHSLKALDIVSILLLLLNLGLNGYITWKINTYFSMGFAAIFFFVILFLIVGNLFVMVMKRKLGLILNVILVLLLGIGSIATMRFHTFVNAVFDNSESETVMIVAKKDSAITSDTDLKDKRLAMIKIDGDANDFAEEILTENKKSGYIKENYATYKEAYDALMDDKSDLMVYTGLARQRLSEDEIDSWSNVKVIYQKNRQLSAIEGTKVDILKDPFTVLISGVDLTSNTINEKGSSDVNILLVVNPATKKIIMQTIPRDTWIPLTCSNNEHTKLTYAGAYGGTDCSIKTLEQYLDVEINYYAKINFNGVIELVDALGGITVNSDASFCESHPLDGYGVRDYCYNAGANDLTGVEALMFSRIRKVFSNGDIARGNHQMEVINAVVRKFKEEPSLTHLNSLMSAVENNFATNLEDDDFGKCLELFLGMSEQLSEIESYSMEGGTEWSTDEVTGEYLYYFYPNEGQLDLVKGRIKDLLNGD